MPEACIYCGRALSRKDGCTCGGPCAGCHKILIARCPTSVARQCMRNGNILSVEIAVEHAEEELAADLMAILDGTYVRYGTRNRASPPEKAMCPSRQAKPLPISRLSGDADLDFAADPSSNDHRADRMIRTHAHDANWLRRLAMACTAPTVRDRAILADYLHRRITGVPLIRINTEVPHVAN